jgi:hypothetical protein
MRFARHRAKADLSRWGIHKDVRLDENSAHSDWCASEMHIDKGRWRALDLCAKAHKRYMSIVLVRF